MAKKWHFWDRLLGKTTHASYNQCSDCAYNTGDNCLLGIDQTPFRAPVEKKPAHSAEYIKFKDAFDKMHKNNDPEILAIYELLRRACRAGNMRLLYRKQPTNTQFKTYTFYSPLLACPVYIEHNVKRIQAKIGNSISVRLDENSTAYTRASKEIEKAENQIARQQSEARAREAAEQAAQRARQKDELMQLLADVRTRRIR